MRVLPYGDHAILVELGDLDAARALYRQLRADPPPGVVDLVPAIQTVLLRFAPETPSQRLRDAASAVAASAVAALDGEGSEPAAGETETWAEGDVVLPVRYDGADLAEAARRCGLAADDLLVRHVSARWTVAFCGFVPGFGYLTSPEWDLDVPRRESPRTKVPAGSVALAGQFSGVYPRESPGGWQLIGHTTAALWDSNRLPPATLSPGTRVRFEAVS